VTSQWCSLAFLIGTAEGGGAARRMRRVRLPLAGSGWFADQGADCACLGQFAARGAG